MITFSNLRQWALSVCIAAFALGYTNSVTAKNATEADNIYSELPFQMNKVQLPVFPDYSRSITEFGAVADGITLNTEAFDKAIKAVAEKGGGKVIVPAGLWLTGPIVLQSNINLYLEENALVLFTADHTQYPIVKTSFEGLETRRCQSPISAFNAENVAITGKGVMDGNGDTWRPVKKDKMTANQWKKLVASGVYSMNQDVSGIRAKALSKELWHARTSMCPKESIPMKNGTAYATGCVRFC